MYMERNNNLNFHILLVVSLIAHLIALIILPGIRERDILKDEEIKKIKAGLVVLKDDTRKKTSSVKKKVAKKQEVKKQVTKVNKTKKKEPVKKKVVKKEPAKVETPKKAIPKPVKKLDLSSIKRKSNRTVNASSVLSVEKTSVSRTVVKNQAIPFETKKITNVDDLITDRKLIDVETNKTQNVRDVKDIKNLEIDTEARKVEHFKPVETLNDTRTLDDNIEQQNIVDLGGDDGEVALPKNIVSQLIEGSGTVEWPESNRLPNYPAEAERNAWNGQVSVILEILDGRTSYTHIDQKSAYPSIDRAVEKAAREWRILIKSNSGLLVDGKVRITVKFDFE